MMTNKELMRSALGRYTLPQLQKLGFAGRYPHFRREREGCIELLSFQTNSHGGSFTVEVSAAFPGHPDPNYTLAAGQTMEDLTVFSTNRRYRLPGMYDRWFHYQDVYRRRFLFFTEYQAPGSPGKGFRLYRAFDEAQAERVCMELNRQLEDAWLWLEQFRASHP